MLASVRTPETPKWLLDRPRVMGVIPLIVQPLIGLLIENVTGEPADALLIWLAPIQSGTKRLGAATSNFQYGRVTLGSISCSARSRRRT